MKRIESSLVDFEVPDQIRTPFGSGSALREKIRLSAASQLLL
jgi:hypothetical protein